MVTLALQHALPKMAATASPPFGRESMAMIAIGRHDVCRKNLQDLDDRGDYGWSGKRQII
jgi:hypothetical protein